MARGRIAHLTILIAFVAAAACSCSTTALSRYYTLDSTAAPGGAAAGADAVLVGPVSVPAAVDRPEFVVEVAPNRVDVDDLNRWASPLSDAIAQAVAGDLVKQLGTPNVAISPLANFEPAYRVTIDVERFDSMPGQSALVEAVWTVRKTRGGETRSGRTVAREPAQGSGFDALAAAHSRAIAKVSGDIATAIRAEAEAQS